jgi:hypothetical protein
MTVVGLQCSVMASTRRTSIRGTVPRGERSRAPKPRPELREPEHVADPTKPRSRIDYALQRRSAVLALFNGGALDSDACDADPYLLRAAKHHGEACASPCPVCKSPELVTVTYVYGDELGPYSGRVRMSEDLPTMATKFGEFKVYVVEVCQKCHWNFLITTYVLGDGVPRRALPTPRDLLPE